jgi:cob(I)alamin adenosyltransferase
LDKKRGLVHVYTGDGKGKTTAAIGLAVRAAGWGKKVLFVQFFKEDRAPSGEKEFFRRGDSAIELIRSNCRHPIFTKGSEDPDEVRKAINDAFRAARERALAGGIDLLVFDEAASAVNGGFLALDELTAFLGQRPIGLEVVLTGRGAPLDLIKAADYVTEMLKIKHPFDAGVPARKGVEY